MMEFVVRYWVEVGFAVMAGMLAAGYRKLFAVRYGVQALLRDRILQVYNHYMEKGFCPIYALENVEMMYKQYHILGGNGTITKLTEELKALPRAKGDIKRHAN